MSLFGSNGCAMCDSTCYKHRTYYKDERLSIASSLLCPIAYSISTRLVENLWKSQNAISTYIGMLFTGWLTDMVKWSATIHLHNWVNVMPYHTCLYLSPIKSWLPTLVVDLSDKVGYPLSESCISISLVTFHLSDSNIKWIFGFPTSIRFSESLITCVSCQSNELRYM